MNTFKKLPLTVAVIAALCPFSALAEQMISQQPVSYTHLTLPTKA